MNRANRFGQLSAALVLFGVIVSGPAAVLAIELLHPQPPWQDAALFAQSWHPLQVLPYAGGFVLVGGLLGLLGSIHALANPDEKARSTTSLLFAAAFAALIFFNYVVQTSFVPALARDFHSSNASLLAALSMSNPQSLVWSVEMWGWGLLGVATWLVAPLFREARAFSWTLATNGPVSLAGAVLTAIAPGWEMSAPGLLFFVAWNALVFAMALLALRELRHRERRSEPALPPARFVERSAV